MYGKLLQYSIETHKKEWGESSNIVFLIYEKYYIDEFKTLYKNLETIPNCQIIFYRNRKTILKILEELEKEYSANDTIQYSISLLKSNISILQELYTKLNKASLSSYEEKADYRKNLKEIVEKNLKEKSLTSK